MPNMDGLEATTRILSQARHKKQPIIIALTANAFDDSREQCIQAGMRDVLTKPLDQRQLSHALSQYIE
jgi:CheY-like chemotaxis protein